MTTWHDIKTFGEDIGSALRDLDEVGRIAVLQAFWPRCGNQPHDRGVKNYDGYLDYLGKQLSALKEHDHLYCVQTLQSLHTAAKYCANHVHLSRATLVEGVSKLLETSAGATEEKEDASRDGNSIARSVELAVRLLTTINVHSYGLRGKPRDFRESTFRWSDDQSIAEFAEATIAKFTGAAPNAQAGEQFINPSLTIAQLRACCGVTIRWTDNLADHLHLNNEQDELVVYRHKICLVNHVNATENAVLPQDFAAETIDTLNLLLPFDRIEIEDFLKQEGQPSDVLGNCKRAINYDLKHYKYWGKRLNAINQLYSRDPRTVQELWSYVRRFKGSFPSATTFMMLLALLGIVITTVGIVITTIASIIATFYTAKQYELARAQACLMTDAEQLLPKFCK